MRFQTCLLPGCDRVEVYHVKDLEYGADGAPKQIDDVTKRFDLQTQGGTTVASVVERKELTGSDASEFLRLWRALKFGGRYSHLCHMPGYGLRFHSSAKVLFDTSLCFECTNFPVKVMGKHGYGGFDGSQPSAGELLKRLQELFPASIPKPRVRLPTVSYLNPSGNPSTGALTNKQP